MSNAINSTHQQDRAAQQKLVNARQHASAQGQQQGAAFARMLSLVCDEDTDLDTLQQGGLGVKTDDKDGSGLGKASANRKGGDKGLLSDGGDGTTEGLSPTAQANATLLALLAQAQGSLTDTPVSNNADTSTTTTSAPDTSALGGVSTETTDTLTQVDGSASAPVPDPAKPTDPALAAPEDKPAPGKTVRDLARQLGAAMRQSSGAQDNAPGHTRDSGVAWGRQPATETAAVPRQVGSGLTPTAANAVNAHENQASALQTPSVGTHDAPAGGADEADTVAEGVAPTELRSSSSDGQSPTGLGGDALGGTELAEHKPGTEDTTSAADQWRDQWAEAMEQMGQQVSYWVGQGGVRQATLRVGNGWQQAMDVKLSMKNGRAHIEFQTDHEAARSAIAQGGSEVLRELLAQSGIALGEVSIGAQAGGGSGTGTDPHDAPQARSTGVVMAAGTDAAASSGTALRPRASQSTGLDLYV